MIPEYRNEPLTDFSIPANESAFLKALETVKASMGVTHPLVIAGEKITLQDVCTSVNPSRPNEVLGSFANGTAQHADQAITAAAEAFKTWQYVAPEDRARYVLRASAEMRRTKHEFSAMMVLEAGKS